MPTEKQLLNLEKRKRFGKEVPPAKSPGRPRTRHFIEYLRETYENNPNPKPMKDLVQAMQKRCPGELAHYLAGKPVTAIELSGPDKGKIEVHSTTQTDAEQELSKRGVFLPS